MKTVGQILKEARVKKGLSFEEIEKEIKIRAKYLKSIEKDDFKQIPGGMVVAKGFIKNYGEHLGLSSKNLLAVFRRDFGGEEKGLVLPRGIYRPLGKIGFAWTPKTTIIAGFLFFIFFFILFLGYQFFLYFSPPKLKVTSPLPNQVFMTSMIEVKGQSDQGAAVYVNGDLVSLDEQGNFSTPVSLKLGENTILVEAVSRRDKKAVVEREVRYQFP
jgi:transcriptional regulator with XRE-family HTH domain